MKNELEPRQSRATTHFKFYSEKFLWGSTRSELLPDERAVWVDFLSLASLNFGDIEVFSREQLAQQLLISPELLDRSIKKFIQFKKVDKKYLKKEKKEIFSVTKWDQYQADYLKKRAKKSTTYEKKERVSKTEESDTENRPTLHNIKEDNIKSNNRKEDNTKEDKIIRKDSVREKNLNHNLTSSSLRELKSLTEEENNTISEILLRLKGCPGYPFDERQDKTLLQGILLRYPRIDYLGLAEGIINGWKKNPEELQSEKGPRVQLEELFNIFYETLDEVKR